MNFLEAEAGIDRWWPGEGGISTFYRSLRGWSSVYGLLGCHRGGRGGPRQRRLKRLGCRRRFK